MDRYPDRQRSRVVLIGTSDYERSDRLPNLPAVWNNLLDLQAVLTDAGSGVFDAEHCTVLASPDSPKTMSRRLSFAARTAEDVLLVYYAGHGLLGWDGALHLAVGETDPDQVAATAVPFEWVRRAIEDSPARTRILILDCCFSGRAVGAMSDDAAALTQVDIRGAAVLTSTSANRVSNSVPGERNTAFTGELVRLLRDGYESSHDLLRIRELYRPLRAALAKRGLPEPKISVIDSVGDLVVRKGSAPPRPPKREAPRPSEPLPKPGPEPPRQTVPQAAAVPPATPPLRFAGIAEVPPTARPSVLSTSSLPSTPLPAQQPSVLRPGLYVPAQAHPLPNTETALTVAATTGRMRRAGHVTLSAILWIVTVPACVLFLASLIVSFTHEGFSNPVGAIGADILLAGLCLGLGLIVRLDLRSYKQARQADLLDVDINSPTAPFPPPPTSERGPAGH